ncbi:MAG: hypothetical protein INH37_04700 [Myxococcaceae bacterium]|nr:hypothetical protein [Myxococcaceae bacterium]
MTPPSRRSTGLLWLLLPSLALAQGQPDEEWQALPGSAPRPAPGPAAAPPLVAPPPVPLPPPTPAPSFPRAPPPALTGLALRRREPPNQVSMFGAQPLGKLKRAQAFVLGFPFVQVKAALGVLDQFDVGLSYETLYLTHHEVRGTAKYGFAPSPGWWLALAFEAGGAVFNTRASREVQGARWLTGRRNFNFAPGFIVSFQGSTVRAARLFVDLRYVLAIDTEPFASTPLQAVPASFIAGHNAQARAGGEFPLSERTSFFFAFGLDLPFRPEDAPAMVNVAVGLVTGF